MPYTPTTNPVNPTYASATQRLGHWRVSAADLERAWTVTHRRNAPDLSWSQRFLLLSSLFAGRPSGWVMALDARLCALETTLAQNHSPVPDAQAFEVAAGAELRPRGHDSHVLDDTRW